MGALSFDQVLAIFLTALALLVGLGVTLAMDAKTRGEVRFAIGCFIFSALMLVYVIGVWDVRTNQLFFRRGLISVALLALVFFGLFEASRWALDRHKRANTEEMSGVVSGSAADMRPPPGGIQDGSSGTTDRAEAVPKRHGTVDRATATVEHPKPLEEKHSAPDLLPQIAQDVGQIKKIVVPIQRHLSDEERNKLVSLLRASGSYETAVRHSQGNMESQIYADDFVAALKEAGWTVNPRPKFLIQERDVTGLWIMVHDMAKAPPCSVLLQESLKAIGLDAPGVAVPGLSPETACELFVGLKAN